MEDDEERLEREDFSVTEFSSDASGTVERDGVRTGEILERRCCRASWGSLFALSKLWSDGSASSWRVCLRGEGTPGYGTGTGILLSLRGLRRGSIAAAQGRLVVVVEEHAAQPQRVRRQLALQPTASLSQHALLS